MLDDQPRDVEPAADWDAHRPVGESEMVLAWSMMPAHVAPDQDEVHLWRAPLDVPEDRLDKLAGLLSADERGRSERIVAHRARARYIAGRHILRAILGRYLGLPSEQVEFTYGPHGKPALAGEQARCRVSFSLAHSRDWMLVAITSGQAVGVDLEFVRPVFDAMGLAERIFSASELAELRAMPPDRQLAGFFRGWTCKEAWLKALSVGLTWPPSWFSVSLRPGELSRLVDVQGDPEAPGRWSLASFEPVPGYVGALAVEGRSWRAVCHDYSHEADAKGIEGAT
jgi:4'-phosphopantetheinyl transferase